MQGSLLGNSRPRLIALLVFSMPANRGRVSQELEKRKKAGLVGKIFHNLRRSAVRFMVQAGVNPQVAKKISGYQTDSIFQRYSILTTDDLRTALEKNGRVPRSGSGKGAANRFNDGLGPLL